MYNGITLITLHIIMFKYHTHTHTHTHTHNKIFTLLQDLHM